LPKVGVDFGLMRQIVGNSSIPLLQGEEGKTIPNALRCMAVEERVGYGIE
jgi:glutaredoxin 2